MNDHTFQEAIRRQIAENAARTPDERMQALFDLLDTARAMAPSDAEAVERRRRALRAREQNRERLREHFRRLVAAQCERPSTGV